MAQITMSDMLKAGLHFGHQTRRWNPKMKQFILTQRNGIHIINLFKSLDMIDKAYDFIKATVAHNGTVLFVGTKKQAQEAVSAQATRVNMPYVSERWLGGMLTNFQTVSKRVSRLKELEEMDFTDVHGSGLTKKELLLLEREKDKLAKQLGGIRNMNRTPSAMFVVDVNKEALAVEEAHKLGIPVVAIVDTYAEATQHVDQGLSLTLFFPDTATTRDLNKAQIYAWRKGIKTLYYIRIRQQALEGTEVQGCVSCML